MKIGIEVHRYAPELNKVHLFKRGKLMGIISTPGITSIAEARKKLFKPYSPKIVAKVEKTYTGEKSWLNRVYKGTVNTRIEALEFTKKIREGLTEGGLVTTKVRLA